MPSSGTALGVAGAYDGADVIECASCGMENQEGSRFCNGCGASLVVRAGIQERGVVTALFADLARSTWLGERLDPEVVRELVSDFFELARAEMKPVVARSRSSAAMR